ncbi:integrase catalytic region, partial [Trifolium medium]|nr:integrase catalytic region [Trifolium medium]
MCAGHNQRLGRDSYNSVDSSFSLIFLQFLCFLFTFSSLSLFFTMPPRIAQVIPASIDTNSIFYVHPSEGAKNKFAIVDGSIPVPDLQDLNRSAWERCNHLIHSWILNSVSEPIAQTLVFHENCFDVWQDLQERFAKIDRIRIATIRSSINNLKQGSKSILEYFTEMKALWEELHSHHLIPSCTCVHQCRCAAMRDARNFYLEDQVIQFLT